MKARLARIERGESGRPHYPMKDLRKMTPLGALVARLVEGASLLEATRFANAAASLFVNIPADQKKSVTFDRSRDFSLNAIVRRHKRHESLSTNRTERPGLTATK